ncbi:hypothetical protein BAUCODRAFT_65886 [Baudoinia panamericana UAMH 10762]|uniref:Transmembrane 9 superfamily member n=1 Tax=Baudoinia panamericana (strain UAMH 10762) TaxID=717646 RepID=M2MQ91_BAUPA|nr:uncharacterized protein BAUCODRAFT_65886 [Baudoinia panamericana UAMH 10762]EMC98946.1 hypothetical protein BAUCODRAFT_65886 [Baudoinia panamericana UAMH 10762]
MAAEYRIGRASLRTCLLLCLPLAHAFYIPGWSIKSYANGEPIPLFVNKVYSDNTQIQYAYSELPFVCPPSGRSRPGTGLISGSNVALNLGEVLRGDRIMVSDYELEMNNDDEVHYLCSQKVDEAGLKKAIEVVKHGYVAEWIVDNLPGATSFVTVDKSRKYYASGFKMGYEETSLTTGQSKYFLNNHVTLMIRYHRAPGKDGQRGRKVIVGFEVYPKSIEAENRDANGLSSAVVALDTEIEQSTLTIPYTYSVYWREEDKLGWGNRWDLYFVDQEDSTKIHWLAIVNSLVISGLLTAVVTVILARTIRSRKNSSEKLPGLLDQLDNDTTLPAAAASSDIDSDDDIPEDITGWKLVHGDVFRPPPYGHYLAPLIGSGTQLLLMSLGLITLSCLGLLNPSYRGGFITVGIILFLLAGALSGHFSARIYRTFGGTNWKHNAILTATLFPGLFFATIFLLNLFVWAQASSTAIPFGTLLALLALWLLIQLPLVYIGSWHGYLRSGPYPHPISATALPRQIPHPQPWYTRPLPSVALAGSIPFAILFIELLFVFKSLWQDKSGYYYLFGYLAVITTITLVSVMQTTVIAVYILLCHENYHWWWRSFAVGASSGAWVFAYCGYYFVHHLRVVGWGSGVLFFAYSALACLVYALLMGTVGFLTGYAFVRRIYGAVKVD